MFRRLNLRKFLAAAATSVAIFGCTDEPLNGSQPTRVTSSCASEITPAGSLSVIASVAMPARPLILINSEVSLRLTAAEDRATAQRLAAIARNDAESVLLQLKCVEADSPPGAMWQVYVGLPAGAKANAESAYFVGNVALFGDGIKSAAKHNAFAEFVFPLDRAIAASSDPSTLQVTFVPSSGIVVEGRPVPAEVKAPVRIGEVNLLLDTAQPTQRQWQVKVTPRSVAH